MVEGEMAEGEFGKFEALINGFLEKRSGIVDSFIDHDLVAGLRQNLQTLYETGKMLPAGIGRHFSFQKNLKVRGDLISWIEKDSDNIYEKQFNNRITEFVHYLNQTCYTGINDFEFHYAYYEQGSFYKRHLDQFKVDHGRKFSLVTYLNEDWQKTDGGKLSLYMTDQEISVLPYGGRSVFFKSDEVEHEVHSALRPHISIAGWLKRV